MVGFGTAVTEVLRARSGFRKWKRVVPTIAVLVLLWLAISYGVTRNMTRRAQPLAPEATPAIAWGTIEPDRVRTSDGEELGAWFIRGQEQQPAVLLLHGNGENRGHCLPQAELLASAGCHVMLVSLRAHGDSTGEINDFGYSARHDVIAAVGSLEKRLPGTPIVVWGQSLGSAAALFAADELPTPASGYILECPYEDIYTAAKNRTSYYLPPPLNAIAYCGLCLTSPVALPQADRISPRLAAERMPAAVPCLILAGEADLRAQVHEARAIQTAIGPEAQLEVFRNGDHLKLHDADPEKYRHVILEFVRRFRRP
jgi:uncharacterized protein